MRRPGDIHRIHRIQPRDLGEEEGDPVRVALLAILSFSLAALFAWLLVEIALCLRDGAFGP